MNQLKQFFKGFKQGMQNFGKNITIIVNSVLLSLVYIVGVGFVFVFSRIFGKNFLDIKLNKKRQTYWTNLNLQKKPIKEYYRQF